MNLYQSFFDGAKFGAPYSEPQQHLTDLTRCCELLLCAYTARLAPYAAPQDAELSQTADGKDLSDLRRDVLAAYDKAIFHIDSRVKASAEQGGFLAAQYLRELFRLNGLEYFCLILWLLPRYDERFGRLFAAMQQEPAKKLPTYDLTLKIFHFTDSAQDVPGYHEQRHALKKKAEFAFAEAEGMLDIRVCEFLLQNGTTKLDHPAAETLLPGGCGPLLMREQQALDLAKAITGDSAENEPLYICVKAAKGCGRTTMVRRVAELIDVPVVMFDCGVSHTSKRGEFFSMLHTAGRETLMVQGMLAVKQFELMLEEPDAAQKVLDIAGRFSGIVFILTRQDTVTVELAEGRRWLDVVITPPDKNESIALWERELSALPLSEEISPAEMANKFSFTPAQIAGTGQAAKGRALLCGKLDRRGLTDAAYSQISHRLGEHATLIYARHTWDQLVLGENEKDMLRSACDQVRYKHIVYDRWGFDKRLAYGKGVSMLFAGPPGTGKTMAAQVVANELGIEMYKVDLSQVVSKYIGETEKNLNQVFAEAKKSNVILFFDETDAILGKRTEVKDAHDKNANLETSYLLQKMEEYDGITVMTTNYKENIDSAFFRRISYVIHFAFPDAKARKAIWQGIFPKETPLSDDIDFDYLSEQFEISGGSIKNIALVASFMAARSDEPVGMRHIVRAVKYEMAKQGKIMLREDYGEYGYLLK